jgi:hypothetical protein
MTAPTGALVVRAGAAGEPFYEAKRRHAGRQVKRRVGPAWLEQNAAGAWKRRRARVAAGLVRRETTVRMAELIAEHAHATAAAEDELREQRERGVTVRELAAEWLDYLEREKGVKPSTLLDYRYLLAEPGTPHERGGGRSAGRIPADILVS